MRKSSTITAFLTVAGVMLLGTAQAQQSAAPKPKTAPATSTRPATAKTAQAPAKAGSTPMVLTTQKQKASYAIGMNIARSMQRDAADIDPNILAQGLKDVLSGGKLLLTDEEAKNALVALQEELQKQQQAKAQAAGEANKIEGQAFLAANKAKEGVVTLPSGLQYKVLTQGTGPKPAATDTVVCNYRGTLINGTEFDSSYKRGEPATFPLDRVIKGWTEAVQLMAVGSKWQLFVPSELAYGERSPSPEIGPNSTLIFEVELMSIKPKDAKTSQPEAQQPAR